VLNNDFLGRKDILATSHGSKLHFGFLINHYEAANEFDVECAILRGKERKVIQEVFERGIEYFFVYFLFLPHILFIFL